MRHTHGSGSRARAALTFAAFAGVVCAIALVACQPARGPRGSAPTSLLPAVPVAPGEHFRISAAQSQVIVLVYRDGTMAALGHNHVIAVHELTGDLSLAADPKQSHFSLSFPVAAMSVDDAALRALQGDDFHTDINASSIQGTRDHMLGASLLAAAQFATIELQSQHLVSSADGLIASTLIQVRDHSSAVDVPIRFDRSGDQLTASGEFDLTHSELGLTPYSVALGALRVAERMHVRYRLVAERAPD